LEQWAHHVNKTVVIKEHVPWQDLPGYGTLIKAFLIELKTKDVRKYPEALINASKALLKNEKLLNIFVVVVYKKTRFSNSNFPKILDFMTVQVSLLSLTLLTHGLLCSEKQIGLSLPFLIFHSFSKVELMIDV